MADMSRGSFNADGGFNVHVAGSSSTGAPADTIATGNLTAAQPTPGTPIAGGTVSIALGEGQGVVEAELTGTFSAGTTVLFEGTDDTGITTNWFTTFGRDTTVQNAPNISQIAGGASRLISIPSGAYQQIRMRCNPYTILDNVAVRMVASVAGTGFGSLATNDGTFATQTTAASILTQETAINTVLGTQADASASSDSGTFSLIALFKRLLAKFPTIGPQAKASSVSVTFATDNPKAGVTAASGDFVDGAIATLGLQVDAVVTSSASSGTAMAFLKNLATIAGAITSAVMQSNTKQIAGTATSVNAGNRDAGTQRIIESGNPTPTVTQVTSANSDTSLLAANANKKGTMFFNDSTQILYLLYGTGTASTTNYSVQIGAKAFFEDPLHYTGGFHGIWASANGFVYCTEVA